MAKEENWVQRESAMQPHILIIGQGLAGTALAWRLWERGVPFDVVDRDEAWTSSKVAAGLMTPITGMRIKVSWEYDRFYREALRFYRGCGQRLGQRFVFPRGYVRVPKNAHEQSRWEKCQGDAGAAPFLNPQPANLAPEVFHAAGQGFQQRHAAWLDTAAFLKASQGFFQELKAWHAGNVQPEDVEDDAAGVMWRGKRFSHVVWAQGWSAMKHPLFDWVPFQPAMGTILTLRADLEGEKRIVNHGCWLLPKRDGSLRAGSTYEWHFSDPNVPTPALVEKLEGTLQGMLRRPFEVVERQTAVRPVIRDRQALMGTHPAHPRVAFLNGLGSKGSLRAPWLARHLVEHLLDGSALDEALDLQQNML